MLLHSSYMRSRILHCFVACSHPLGYKSYIFNSRPCDIAGVDYIDLSFCRIFQSDLHFSRRSGECDEVPSRHEPPKSHRPWARYSVDWSLCGQCCKYDAALWPLHGDFLCNPLPAYILYVIMTPCLHAKCTNMLSMQEGCSEGNFQCKIQSRTLNYNEVLRSLTASCFVMLLSLLYSKRTCASLPSDHCSSSCCWNDCLLWASLICMDAPPTTYICVRSTDAQCKGCKSVDNPTPCVSLLSLKLSQAYKVNIYSTDPHALSG